MSDDKLNIKVVIADRNYRLKVAAGEEERVRKAAQLIKDKMIELRSQYGAKDRQDYLAMATLLLCVDLLEKEENHDLATVDESIGPKLDELDGILSSFLNKN